MKYWNDQFSPNTQTTHGKKASLAVCGAGELGCVFILRVREGRCFPFLFLLLF